jgi:hypothetical protein
MAKKAKGGKKKAGKRSGGTRRGVSYEHRPFPGDPPEPPQNIKVKKQTQ